MCRSLDSQVVCLMLLRDLFNTNTGTMILSSVLQLLRIHIVDKRITWKESILSHPHHTVLLLELLIESIDNCAKKEVNDLNIYAEVQQIGIEAMNALCTFTLESIDLTVSSFTFRFLVRLHDFLSSSRSISGETDTSSLKHFQTQVASFLHYAITNEACVSLNNRESEKSSMVRSQFISSYVGCTVVAQWIHLFTSVKLSCLQTNDIDSNMLLQQSHDFFPTPDQLIQILADQDDLLISVLDNLLQIWELLRSKCGWKEETRFLNASTPDVLFGRLLELLDFDALVLLDLLTSPGTHRFLAQYHFSANTIVIS